MMHISTHSKQQGVALVVSLIILVSLTMIGMTAIQRTTTDLSMAGNQRETGLMFQSAEVGLDAAEDFIGNSTTNADYNDVDAGLHTVLDADNTYFSPDYFSSNDWDNRSSLAATNLVGEFGVVEEPRFMIEYLGDRSQNALAAINIGGYGTQQTGDVVSIYRSTARGVGLTGNSFRYLQSYFGKDAP